MPVPPRCLRSARNHCHLAAGIAQAHHLAHEARHRLQVQPIGAGGEQAGPKLGDNPAVFHAPNAIASAMVARRAPGVAGLRVRCSPCLAGHVDVGQGPSRGCASYWASKYRSSARNGLGSALTHFTDASAGIAKTTMPRTFPPGLRSW